MYETNINESIGQIISRRKRIYTRRVCRNMSYYAYIFLLTECRGKSVMECNEILEALGIEEKYRLGSYARRDNKS